MNTTLNESLLYDYYDSIFEKFAKEKDVSDNEVDLSYNIQGRTGTYDGDGFDVFFSPLFIK